MTLQNDILTFVSQDGGNPSPLVVVWAVCDWPPLRWLPAAAIPGGFDSACPTHSSSFAKSHTQSPFHPPRHHSEGTAGKRHSPRSQAWHHYRDRETVKRLCHLLVKMSTNVVSIYTQMLKSDFNRIKNNENQANRNICSASSRRHFKILLGRKKICQVDESCV